MACCFASAEERAATRRSREIDRYLKMERKRATSQLNILLLGTQGSGKSTFWKQMRILYGEGYSEDNRLQQRPVIYSTVLNGMKEVIWCLKEFHIPFQHPENEQNSSMFEEWHDWFDCGVTTDVVFSSYVQPLMSLWRDEGIREAAKRAELYTLKESFHYFMNNMDTIGQPGYIPSVQDVLHCQSPTIGISELVVDISETVLCRLISFGGSRSSRRRWIHVFEDVTCVFFFVASNEFDQTLREDGETNRLRESITLFEVILNYPWFRSAPIFLILNKCDLLSEKIKEKNIGDYFSDFEGDPHNLDDVQKFLLHMFDSVRPHDHTYRKSLSYFMTATESANVRTVFTEVKDKIINTRQKSY